MIRTPSTHINVTALAKGRERYVFLWDREHVAESLRMLCRFASNPELSFTWYDAACLSNRIRKQLDSEAMEGVA